MYLIKLTSKAIGEPVEGFKKASSGWFTVIRKNSTESLRYNLKLLSKEGVYKALLYDFRDETTRVLNVRETLLPEDLNLLTKDLEEKPLKELAYFEKYGFKATESLYLKNKSIPFPKSFTNIKKDDYGNTVVPYTDLEVFKKVVGIKLYAPKGLKKCLKGSKMRGSVFFARKNLDYALCYVVEGFADAAALALSMTEGDIIESGGLSNTKNVLNWAKDKYTKIVLVGENDTVSKYLELAASSSKIKVVFPPKGKDIADYYVLDGPKKVAEALTESIGGAYKALGFLGKRVVLYSKTLRAVEDFSINNATELITLGLGLTNIGALKKDSASQILSKVIGECAKHGQYSTAHEKGVGLYKYQKKVYYNAGGYIYQVGDGRLNSKSHGDIVREDFLVVSRNSKLNKLDSQDFDFYGLLACLKLCDWEQSFYADIFLGFLIQSVFAASTEFSPHMWLESNKPKSGKSWLTSWVKETLMPDAPAHDGSGSTYKGFRQSLRFWKGLTFIDEFAESGSMEKLQPLGMIKTMRVGAVGNVPITLGTKEQVPIEVWVKFSSLLTCIRGQDLFLPQDYERTIFLKMVRNEETLFMENKVKAFHEFKNKNTPEGFLRRVIQSFKYYDKNYLKYLIEIEKRKPSIGHKARGLAAILAGYEGIFNSEDHCFYLMQKCLEDRISAPLKDEHYIEDTFVDIMNTLIPKSVSGYHVDAPLHVLLDNDFFTTYNCRSRESIIILDLNLLSPILNKYWRKVNLGLLGKKLRDSSYYLGYYFLKNSDQKTVRCLKFKKLAV